MGPRRSHRKSRNGCRECKTRRLKCDERYPCTNCVKHGIPCSYVAPVNPSDASPAPSTPPELRATRSQPSQPQSQVTTPSGLAAWTAASSENRADLLDLLCTSPEDTPSKEDWALDLELMHHFSTVTCNTLAIRPDARHTWQSVVPVEGYSNEYVMHGLLAIAAMHRSYLYPAQRDRYTKASAYHQAAGLKEFRDLIASPIDSSNWQPVFCFASMITVHVCALPLRLGVDRWPAPILNMVEVFSVITGFQTIMEPFIPSLKKTQWAPFVLSVWIEDEKMLPNLSAIKQSLLPPDTWTQIDRLREFIQDYPFPQSSNTSHPNQDQDHDQRSDYKTALFSLEKATRQIELAGPNAEFGMILLWAYRLSKRFRDDLESYQPAALILLAHWCVLLHVADHYWFVNGAARQLFEDIERKIVHPEIQEWLAWPRQWVSKRRVV